MARIFCKRFFWRDKILTFEPRDGLENNTDENLDLGIQASTVQLGKKKPFYLSWKTLADRLTMSAWRQSPFSISLKYESLSFFVQRTLNQRFVFVSPAYVWEIRAR